MQNQAMSSIPKRIKGEVEELINKEPSFSNDVISFNQNSENKDNKTLYSILSPHKKTYALVFFILIINSIASNSGPMIFAYAIDHGIIAKNQNILLWLGVAYMALTTIKILADRTNTAITGKLAQKLIYQVRIRTFSHLQRLSLEYHTKNKSGKILSKMTNDIESMTKLFQDDIVLLFLHIFSLIIITSALFYLNVQLALLIVFIVIPCMLFLTFWYASYSHHVFKKLRIRIAETVSDLKENIAGIRLILASNRQQKNIQKHQIVTENYRVAYNKSARMNSLYTTATEIIRALVQCIILVVGFFMIKAGNLTIGELIAFILFLTRFFEPIQSTVIAITNIQSGKSAINRIWGILSEKPSIRENTESQDMPPIIGEVKLENITIEYEKDHPVLSGINLHIKAGEKIALVGPTGSGKTSLTKLINRMYDPKEGKVMIDGTDIKDTNLNSLRSQIGIVPQESFLFHQSIRDNITFSVDDLNDEQIEEMCAITGLDKLIDKLPHGIDSSCRERGSVLSSGEKQIIALTRVMLSQPKILILDEATSNIDFEAESLIGKAIQKISTDLTTIIVAHRIETAKMADKIVVIDNQKIMEKGTHESLLEKGGEYAKLYAIWKKQQDRP